MILWEMFTNKYFWGVILSISLGTAIWSYVKNKENQEFLENAPIMYCVDYRDSIKISSILVITDITYAPSYIAYFSESNKKQEFRSYSIQEGSRVKILDKKFDNKLVKIILVDKAPKRRIYEESWVWHEFLSPTPH